MDTNADRDPVIIRKSDKRRRFAALIAVGSLGAAALVGATMASFTDHEYAGLNDTTGNGYAAAVWNLQISADDGDTWVDTTAPDTANTPDNTADDVAAPVNLVIPNGTGLIPGDTSTDAVTTFKVRNDTKSTQNAQLLEVKFLTDAGAGTTSAAVRDALRFTVERDAVPVGTNLTYAALAAGVTADQPILAPGAVVTYTITADIPDQGGAVANAALQGLHAYLVADVNGTSTTTTATIAAS